jgi:23S rRNA pseudouridine2457 synthase
MLIALNKPFGVLSQFTPDHPGQRTLAEFGLPPGVWPIGRLDKDSEGLLLLGNEPELVSALLDPDACHPRTYLAQVEGKPDEASIACIENGITIKGRRSRKCRVWVPGTEPDVPDRNPPIRFRASIPASWICLELVEGMNRQVRRMTAAAGLPTLRLLRIQIGRYPLDLQPGTWKELNKEERLLVLSS